jgi:hypothetical protein
LKANALGCGLKNAGEPPFGFARGKLALRLLSTSPNIAVLLSGSG